MSTCCTIKRMKNRRRVAGLLLATYIAFLIVFFTVQYFILLLKPYDKLQHEIPIPHHRSRQLLQMNKSTIANCSPAGVDQFPKDFMTSEFRKHGGVAVHIFLSLYVFLALAIVCDEYFVPSLENICKALNIKSDVAGATFMAAGSSAPELATSLLAVFLTKDDIGVGTVVGSAVYNVAFVVAVCGLFAGKVIYLNWWPLFRDCLFYSLSIVALILMMLDHHIDWFESLILIMLYMLYIVFMFVNEKLESYFTNLPLLSCLKPKSAKESLALMSYKNVPDSESESPYSSGGTFPAVEGKQKKPPPGSQQPESPPSSDLLEDIPTNKGECTPVTDESTEGVLHFPESTFKRALWIVSLPVLLGCYLTVPDCRETKWRKWFIVTFVNSCIWIGAYSYVLVWMITIIGYTFNVPDTVMGLTFLAAGVSVPDAVTSLLVAREGLGDMAISNAVGSNVFDILICLGVPWFLQTALIEPGSVVLVYSDGLIYTSVSLMGTVFFLLLVTHINGYKLNRKYGAIMMIWYLLFMVVASLYQLNIFGNYNLPTCLSNF